MSDKSDKEKEAEAVARELPEQIARVRSRVEQAKARLRKAATIGEGSVPLDRMPPAPGAPDSKAE